MENFLASNTIADDADIIAKIIIGEPALFEILIRRTNGVLYKIARSYGFNHQDAEDLMQETHIAAYQNLPQFAFKASYKTWVSKIMIHKCLYKLNHGYMKNEMPASQVIHENAQPVLCDARSVTPEQSSMNKEFTSVLEHSLQNLPLIYRSVFVLREVEGFSVAETAELLSITPINVKVRLNRAKTMLQKELEQFYTAANIYDFNLIYCDKIVATVFRKIYSAR